MYPLIISDIGRMYVHVVTASACLGPEKLVIVRTRIPIIGVFMNW